MGSLWQDARYGFRAFTRTPGFASIVVIVLAVGIGAAISVFTVFNALVFRPLPLAHPEQLAQFSGIYRNNSSIPISYPMFAELEREQDAFSGICGWSAGANFNVEANGSVTASAVHSVTGNYYTVLGVSPLMGRLISPGDTQGNQISQVAVIGYELWKERFGGDPAVVGKNIRIDGKLFTIIGVTRRWFTGMIAGSPPEITIPAGAAQLYDLESRSLLWVFVTGRLNEGTGIEQARIQLQTFWPRLLEDTVPTQSIGPRRQSFLAMRFRIDPASAGSKNIDLRSKFLKPDFQDLEIVGVAQNARILDIRDGNAPVIYTSALQLRDFVRGGTLLLRGSASAGINKAIVDEIRSFNHEYATGITTFEEKNERSFVYEQMTATLSTLFASIALLVAGFGLFGLMSYAVTLRTREIGIRMAMGSQRRGILQLVLRDAVVLTLAGIAVGIPFTLAATRLIAHMIFGLSPADPVTLAGASLTMLLVGTLAGYLPAFKATKMNPVIALRHD